MFNIIAKIREQAFYNTLYSLGSCLLFECVTLGLLPFPFFAPHNSKLPLSLDLLMQYSSVLPQFGGLRILNTSNIFNRSSNSTGEGPTPQLNHVLHETLNTSNVQITGNASLDYRLMFREQV